MIAYQQPIGEVLSKVASDPKTGLSAAEAAKRLERYGRNELQAEKRTPAWKKFLAQFRDVLVNFAHRRRCDFCRHLVV